MTRKLTYKGRAMNISKLCCRFSMRSVMGVPVILLLGLTTGCLAQSGTKSEATVKPELTVKWLPPCSTNITDPYFSMEVFTDGNVRYVGGEQAREVGERQIKIGKQRAQKLIRVARSTVNGSTKVIFDDYDHRYCLEIEQSKGEKPIIKGAAGEQRMQDVIKKFSELTSDNKLVCPARSPGENRNHALYYSGYCGGYMAREVITFAFFDENTCLQFSGSVYEDIIYYSESRRIEDNTFVPLVRSGTKAITADQLERIAAAAREARVRKIGFEEPNARIDQDYFGQTAFGLPKEDLLPLKQVLYGLFKDQGLTGASNLATCSSVGVSEGLVLRYEYGPPLH